MQHILIHLVQLRSSCLEGRKLLSLKERSLKIQIRRGYKNMVDLDIDIDIDIDIDKYIYIYTCHHIVITKHCCYSFTTSYQISCFKKNKKVIPPGHLFCSLQWFGRGKLAPWSVRGLHRKLLEEALRRFGAEIVRALNLDPFGCFQKIRGVNNPPKMDGEKNPWSFFTLFFVNG